MNAPRGILEMTDAQMAARTVPLSPHLKTERLIHYAWKAHAARIGAPITAAGVTFDPGADWQATLQWLGHSYAAAKNGVVTDFLWVHDDGTTQSLTAAQLIAIYEAGAVRTETMFAKVGSVILPGIANGSITTWAQIDQALDGN